MIKFFDMKLANKKVNINKIISNVVGSYEFSLGKYVEDFEKNFSTYLGVKYCVGVGNGTDGLQLSLLASGINASDSVVTVSNAGFYSSTAIRSIGAKPEFIDVNDSDLLINLALLESFIEKNNVSAVIITHLFGQVVDMKKVIEITKKHNIKIIEDCSHAHGALIEGKKAGSFGDASVFSFYPTKNLGAIGDGGIVATNSKKIYKNLLSLRQYGWNKKYYVENRNGRNSRLDAIQAAVLNEKLNYLDSWNNMRIDLAKKYHNAFLDLPLVLLEKLTINAPHLYVIRTKERNKLIDYLNANKIQTQIHYPVPDHLQKIETRKYKNLNITEESSKEVLSLPLYPNMTKKNQNKIIENIRFYYKGE